MDYSLIFDTAVEIGYQLAMHGAETYRIEESINRITAAYGAKAEVFAIPNSMTATVLTPDGETITRLRRIGFHGNDMDTVELYSNLSRRICAEKPEPKVAAQWLKEAASRKRSYKLPIILLGNMLGSFGFCLFFGGTIFDSLVSALCGLAIGSINYFSAKLHINSFFATMVSAFAMAFVAYLFGSLGINADVAIIGSIMILVPGLLFTNAIRDIIFGDINSGVNRLVQVILFAVAIGLGTGVASSISFALVGAQPIIQAINYGPIFQCIATAIGCAGFCILYNIHGRGQLICILGGLLSWAVYLFADFLLPGTISGYLLHHKLSCPQSGLECNGKMHGNDLCRRSARNRHFDGILHCPRHNRMETNAS